MAFFNNSAEKPEPTRQSLEQKYSSARRSVLTIVVFTVVNMVLLILNSNVYFLCSAFIPYFITGLGMALCGRMPKEFYGEDYLQANFLPPWVLTVIITISVLIISVYLACWMFSRDLRGGWMICAFVVFSLDTIAMLLLMDSLASSLFDIIFHGWVLFDIGRSLNIPQKIKRLDAAPADNDDPCAPTDPQ